MSKKQSAKRQAPKAGAKDNAIPTFGTRWEELFLCEILFQDQTVRDSIQQLLLKIADTRHEQNPIEALEEGRKALRSGRALDARKLVQDIDQFHAAVCAVYLGNVQEAIRLLESCRDSKNDDALVLSALSYVAYMDGRADDAAELSSTALKLDGNCAPAMAGYILALHAAGRKDELALAFEQNAWLQTDAACLSILAHCHIIDQNYAEAEKYLRKCISIARHHPHYRLLIAECQYRSAMTVLVNDTPLDGALHPDVRRKLEDAADHISESIKLGKKARDNPFVLRALVNKAAIRALTKNFTKALEDLNLALSIDEMHPRALLNKGQVLLLLGACKDAEYCLKKVSGAHTREAARMLAEADYRSGQLEQAAQILEQASVGDTALSQTSVLVWTLRELHIELEQGKKENAESDLQKLARIFAEDISGLQLLGEFHRRVGNNNTAVALLQKARETASGNLRAWVCRDLARLYTAQGKHVFAADEYSQFVDKEKNTQESREYAVALYRAGLLPAAFEQACRIRKANGGDVVPGISNIEVEYLLRGTKFADARELVKGLLKHTPDSVQLRIALVKIHLVLGEKKQAKKELDTVQHQQLDAETASEMEKLAAQLKR